MAEYHQLPPYPIGSRTTASSNAFQALNINAEQRTKECTPAPMLSLDHIDWKDYEKVYPPSDDTFLLLDAIHLSFQSPYYARVEHDQLFTALEIGCGTGTPIVFLGKQLLQQQQQQENQQQCPCPSFQLLATDCNPHAIRVTRDTANVHGLEVQTFLCDLASALIASSPRSRLDQVKDDEPCNSTKPSWENAVDVLLFNPPYVPTPDEEVVTIPSLFKPNCNHANDDDDDGVNAEVGIEASWAGGLHGRRVIDRAIPQIAHLLRKPTGVAYMITVDDNLPEQLADQLSQNWGLQMEPWVRRRAHNEFLTVQRITWIQK